VNQIYFLIVVEDTHSRNILEQRFEQPYNYYYCSQDTVEFGLCFQYECLVVEVVVEHRVSSVVVKVALEYLRDVFEELGVVLQVV
jgi:hypothetical protein